MDLDALTEHDRVMLLEQAFSSVDELCDHLGEDDWDRPTDLPGWTVKDNLSHLVSYEAAALGRPRAPADLDVSKYPYVTSEFQVANEREVELHDRPDDEPPETGHGEDRFREHGAPEEQAELHTDHGDVPSGRWLYRGQEPFPESPARANRP